MLPLHYFGFTASQDVACLLVVTLRDFDSFGILRRKSRLSLFFKPSFLYQYSGKGLRNALPILFRGQHATN